MSIGSGAFVGKNYEMLADGETYSVFWVRTPPSAIPSAAPTGAPEANIAKATDRAWEGGKAVARIPT